MQNARGEGREEVEYEVEVKEHVQKVGWRWRMRVEEEAEEEEEVSSRRCNDRDFLEASWRQLALMTLVIRCSRKNNSGVLAFNITILSGL